MGGSFGKISAKNIFNRKAALQQMNFVKNNDPKTNLENKVAEGIELRIVECANILVKMDDQFTRKGNQLLRVAMVTEQNFKPY
jgi:hypothetical protein